MEWRDEGIILGVKPHGETSAIAEILTQGHGRCLGLVRGGRSRTMRPVLQAGNHVACVWRARLEEHAGGGAVGGHVRNCGTGHGRRYHGTESRGTDPRRAGGGGGGLGGREFGRCCYGMTPSAIAAVLARVD